MKRAVKQTVFCPDIMRRLQWTLVPFIFALLLSAPVTAASRNAEKATALFEQANILYTQGEFQQAAEQYAEIIAQDGISAPLLYNLANSYAATGQVGPAVLNYERALRVAPNDTDIQGNLDLVRKDAGLYRDDRPLYRRAAEMLGADQWLLLAGCALLCAGISALLATLLAGKKKKALHGLAFCSALIVLLTLPPACFRYQDWRLGVVLAEHTHLLISPFADAAPAGDIRAGRLIRPQRTHGEYMLVTTETGKSGWLPESSFALIAEEIRK